jgi:hypothetical protein
MMEKNILPVVIIGIILGSESVPKQGFAQDSNNYIVKQNHILASTQKFKLINSHGWARVTEGIETKCKFYSTESYYFAAKLSTAGRAAFVDSSEFPSKRDTKIEDLFKKETVPLSKMPVATIGFSNYSSPHGVSIGLTYGLYIKEGKVLSTFQNEDIYRGVVYISDNGEFDVLPVSEFKKRLDELKPAYAVQADLVWYGGKYKESKSPDANKKAQRIFLCKNGKTVYIIAITGIKLTKEWIKTLADIFKARIIAAFRTGSEIHAGDNFGTRLFNTENINSAILIYRPKKKKRIHKYFKGKDVLYKHSP